MQNSFQFIDDADETAPAHLKKEIVSEIDTIRGGMEVFSLFVGRFFTTAGAAMTPPAQQNDNSNSNNYETNA